MNLDGQRVRPVQSADAAEMKRPALPNQNSVGGEYREEAARQ